jgi:hypothetical protein
MEYLGIITFQETVKGRNSLCGMSYVAMPHHAVAMPCIQPTAILTKTPCKKVAEFNN